MASYLRNCSIILLSFILAGCELSKYPIDDPAMVRIDARLLGTWRVDDKEFKDAFFTLSRLDDLHYQVTTIDGRGKDRETKTFTAYLSEVKNVLFLNVHNKDEKTDVYAFFKITDVNPYNTFFMKNLFLLLMIFFPPGIWSSGIKNACKYSIDEKPVVRIDDHLQGIWKLAEDTDFHNYFIIEKDGDFAYSITYMNRSGNNRGLEHGRFFFSEINNVKFINIPNWDEDYPGYIFLKIKNITKGSWDMTATLVTDTTLSRIQSNAELRIKLEKNLNNPLFYGKELHFRKKFEFNSFR